MAIRVDGSAVRRKRIYEGWTLKTLAGRAGIHLSYLARIEVGAKENVGAERLKRLADALGTTVPEITIDDDAKGPAPVADDLASTA